MKLRNKKTGEIVDTLCRDDITKGLAFGIDHHNGNPTMAYYNSLSELNKEWEDYEEPDEVWYIDWKGDIRSADIDGDWECEKQIGNYFATREEAEKAVEKLKAWKRLKDKGFDIESWTTHIGDNYYKTGQIVLNLNNVMDRDWDEYNQIMEIKNDLDLLFGGEE